MQTAHLSSRPPVTCPWERHTLLSSPIAQGLNCAAHQWSYNSSKTCGLSLFLEQDCTLSLNALPPLASVPSKLLI